MLHRHVSEHLKAAAAKNPVVTLTGPRQSGKTTLCRALFPNHEYISLEAPDFRAQAIEDPRGLLSSENDLVIDEVQRAPDILSYIQVLVDEQPRPGRFILTGSQNLLLLRSVSQTLAGRTALLRLLPFTLQETCGQAPFQLQAMAASSAAQVPAGSRWEALFKGFYPRIHDQNLSPTEWLGDYFRTYVERDLREVIEVSDPRTFENFVKFAAANTAQELNLSRMANDVGVGQQTARRWLHALEIGYLAITLPPHHANFRKRLRKQKRLHFLDTGLICYLLGIRDAKTLAAHPLRGAIFESFVVSEIFKNFTNRRQDPPLYFWRDSTGHEIDLLIDFGDRLLPLEVKSGETVATDAVNNLDWWTSIPANPASSGLLVHGGNRRFQFKGFEVLPWFLG